MTHYGIDSIVYKLIISYFEYRKQYGLFNKDSSDLRKNNNGVPQGNMLWPLLFLIFIHDTPNASNSFKKGAINHPLQMVK